MTIPNQQVNQFLRSAAGYAEHLPPASHGSGPAQAPAPVRTMNDFLRGRGAPPAAPADSSAVPTRKPTPPGHAGEGSYGPQVEKPVNMSAVIRAAAGVRHWR